MLSSLGFYSYAFWGIWIFLGYLVGALRGRRQRRARHTGQRVAGRGQATLVIEFTCGRVEGGGQLPALSTPSVPIKLEIAVRTPIGLDRTRTTRTVDLPITCFG